ncbi:MAG: bifunctional oligoribonuclease/PAP phosphatase NrnA [Clostridiaceae bacterium]|jgi:phosphoesterase RecJ-like protein|nr:bifunctional oligoribonuclease/PAP phosphatase NrnA [Clostridiaceae bacterium]
MSDKKLEAIAKALGKAGSVAIMPHLNVDGDALGASLALALALSSDHCQADVILEEEVPAMLDFLPGQDLIKVTPKDRYEVALNIDNGDINRLGGRLEVYQNAGMRLSLDHHATNKVEADISYVDTKASATGEIVYKLLTRYMGLPVTQDIALCLYTAIITDTGGFRFSNTTPETMVIAGELMRTGIDFTSANKMVFDRISYAKLFLMKQTMNSLKLLFNGKMAVSYLRWSDLASFNAKLEDTEGLVNIGRNLEGVEVSLFLKEEKPGSFKGSLRSNEYVNVAKVAEEFGGGGHKRAAGFTIEGDLEDIVRSLADAVKASLAGEA